MSKFGWSYPPGCTQQMVDDAVGGGPEAEAAFEFAETMREKCIDLTDLDEEIADRIIDYAWKQVSEAYAKGYAQANADHSLAENERQIDEKSP